MRRRTPHHTPSMESFEAVALLRRSAVRVAVTTLFPRTRTPPPLHVCAQGHAQSSEGQELAVALLILARLSSRVICTRQRTHCVVVFNRGVVELHARADAVDGAALRGRGRGRPGAPRERARADLNEEY